MLTIFDTMINRKNTESLKWDYCLERFGKIEGLQRIESAVKNVR